MKPDWTVPGSYSIDLIRYCHPLILYAFGIFVYLNNILNVEATDLIIWRVPLTPPQLTDSPNGLVPPLGTNTLPETTLSVHLAPNDAARVYGVKQ